MTNDRGRGILLTTLCVGLALAAVIGAAVLSVTGPPLSLTAFAVLGFLCVFAANTSVVLPNESALSASFMLAIAAIVVFRDQAELLGPLAVGMSAGVYLPHVTEREWRKLLFNIGSLGLSALAAAAVYAIVPTNVVESVGGQLAAAIPTALTYSLVNFVFLVCALSLSEERRVREVADELWLGDLQIYPFALIGVLLGRLYVDLGAWVVPLFVAPILIARQAFASYLALRSAQQGILETLIHALEAKDRYTAGHAERVARYARMIGVELGFKTRRLERLHQAALMHDVGKLVVPNQLLRKPGKLTPEEFDLVRRHEPVSLELIRRIDFLLPIAPTIEAELMDAADGVPAGPLEGRIIAVCDAFDAMTSTRAYRRALSQGVAFAELRDKAGVQFDAECVETLIRLLEDLGEEHGAGHEADVTEFDVPPPTAGIGSAGLGDLENDEREVPAP